MKGASSIGGQVTFLDLLQAPIRTTAADLLEAKRDALILDLARRREAVLQDFLSSGAMPRDIGTEHGRMAIEWCRAPDAEAIRLRVVQPWRVV